MTELLTTGEMVNRLKVGEIAECINVPEYETLSRKQRQVEINNLGNLEWRDKVNFTVTEFVRREALWKILPNYVSFSQAMKALKEGKMVYFHPDESQTLSCGLNRTLSDSWLGSYSLDHLLNGKWTIRGDK